MIQLWWEEGPLYPDFQPLELRNKFVFKLLTLVFCYSSPGGLIVMYMNLFFNGCDIWNSQAAEAAWDPLIHCTGDWPHAPTGIWAAEMRFLTHCSMAGIPWGIFLLISTNYEQRKPIIREIPPQNSSAHCRGTPGLDSVPWLHISALPLKDLKVLPGTSFTVIYMSPGW